MLFVNIQLKPLFIYLYTVKDDMFCLCMLGVCNKVRIITLKMKSRYFFLWLELGVYLACEYHIIYCNRAIFIINIKKYYLINKAEHLKLCLTVINSRMESSSFMKIKNNNCSWRFNFINDVLSYEISDEQSQNMIINNFLLIQRIFHPMYAFPKRYTWIRLE